MYKFQLINFLSGQEACKDQFLGVFAADDLPATLPPTQCFFIANTDVSSGLGKHWVTMFFPSSGPAEFWDSLGRQPEEYHEHFRGYLCEKAATYKFQNLQIQGHGSDMCGLFCIFYAMRRCKGWTLEQIIACFAGKSGWTNDQTVRLAFYGKI